MSEFGQRQLANQAIDELIESNSRIWYLESMLVEWYEQQAHKARRGNAPGHGHDVTGVWGSDNGILAGQKCAECALWSEAERLYKHGYMEE